MQTLTSGPLDLSLDSCDVFRPIEGALPCRRLFGICSCLEVLGGSEGGRGKNSHVHLSHTSSVSSSSFFSRYFELAVEGLQENFATNLAV